MNHINIKDVKSLLKALEKENFEKANTVFERLIKSHDDHVIEQVEVITQNLHNSLEGFEKDTVLFKHTKHDLPDASERLQYVIQSTEDASSKTLASSENVMAILETIESSLSEEQRSSMSADLERAKSEVTEIMIAQSFQDLTGQVLNRVILLVTSLEQSLTDLIEHSGVDLHSLELEETEEEKRRQEEKGIGPNVTRDSKADSAATQNDVDDLLSDLGI